LVLMGISGYFLYQNFQKYQQVKEGKKYLELTEKLENMLVYLGQERGTSSIYSVSKGEYPNSKKILAKKRAHFTKAINELKTFVNQNPEFYNSVKNVLNIANQLPIIRKKIDSFKENYIKTYFFKYYTVLETEIIKSIAQIQNHFPDKVKATFTIKFPFERIISFSGIVRGFGSFYITADTPMSKEEYKNVLMKYYHDTNILPLYLLKEHIRKQFESKDFQKIERDIKTVLFYIQQANIEYYLTGEFNGYPIDALDYFELFTKRISYFQKAVKNLNSIINREITQISQEATQNLIVNALVFGLAVLLLFLGAYIVRLIKLHIQELSELITSLTPITGEEVKIDIASAKGINEAVKVVDRAIKVIQESVKKAEEATKAKSLFLANMSHEIRTPLNGILGFLEVLKTTDLTPEQEEYVNTIAQSAKNLLQIVNNILDVSKIESQKVSLEIIDFKAVDEFENTLEIFATPTAQKQIQYVTEISPNIPSVLKGDILKIKEILTNLINNAIKFTHEKGIISVRILLEEVKDNKASIYFEVKDTGIGMSEEQKEKIFEAFTQADESVTRKYGGTGLGLTIVKSYLEMMGSYINVESEVNKGSKFYFTIEFDIADKTPRYKQNIFANTTFAILNTLQDTLRKEYSLEYLNYFGVGRIGFNDKNELEKIRSSEKIDAAVVFYEESDKEKVEELMEINLPVIIISSFAYKEEINKLNPDTTIYDPNVPSKTYNAITSTKEQKVVTHKVKKEVQKPIYQLRALIAEDNPINQKLLKTKLKSMGIEAETANNGLEAFTKYSMNPDKYDVIFMDVQMPVMDGVETTQEILEFEKEEGIPHTPIIAVTANVLKGDREKFLGAGMDDYVSKPIEQRELERVIENVSKHKYSSLEEIEQIQTEQISQPEEQIQSKEESKKQQTIQPQRENIVIASESSFLINYLKNVLDFDFESTSQIIELNKKLDKNAKNVLIIEDNFNGADMENLINSLKSEFPNIKIIVIGEKQYPNTDGIISDLNPQEIKQTINSIKGR